MYHNQKTKSMFKNVRAAIWQYIREMNTGTNGRLSINRNMAWGIATTWVVIQLWAMYVIPHASDTEIGQYIKMCITFVLIDAAFVILALGITSIEKITELAQKLRFGIFGNTAPEKEPQEAKEVKEAIAQEPQPQVKVTTETTINQQP